MRHFKSIIAVFLGGISLMLVSCDQNRILESSQKIPNGIWAIDTTFTFSTVIEDTTATYSFYLDVRNDIDYGYSNLYLFLTTHFPNGIITRDTIECMLASYQGKWLGSGIGSIRSNRFLFQDGMSFPLSGTYIFKIEQAMREEPLNGIRDIGIRIDIKNQ